MSNVVVHENETFDLELTVCLASWCWLCCWIRVADCHVEVQVQFKLQVEVQVAVVHFYAEYHTTLQLEPTFELELELFL